MKNLSIGVIGAGNIGLAFAKQAATAGRRVIISNSRGPATLQSHTHNVQNLFAGTAADAAAADIVMIALNWQQLTDNAAKLPDLRGKIVLDPMNPIIMPGFIVPDLDGRSSSEVVSSLFPYSRLVKVFNTLSPALLSADPKYGAGNRVIFYSGDDTAAKNTVAELILDMGFAGIELGSLADGGRMQQFPGGSLTSLNLIKLGFTDYGVQNI